MAYTETAETSDTITPDFATTLEDEEFKAIIQSRLSDATDFVDNFLAPDRAKATKYYLSREFGDEESGRSQYIDSTLRDTVHSILPSLLKIFFSSERVVQFVPRRESDVPFAEQATDYIRWLFTQKNNGFMALHSAFQDALIRGNGFLKYWYEESETVDTRQYTGLDDDTLALLLDDDEIEVVSVDSTPLDIPSDLPPEQMPMQHDCEVQRRSVKGDIRIESVPPEEVLMNRRNKGFDDRSLDFVAHRRVVTLGELQSLGYETEDLESFATSENALDFQQEYSTRRPETQYGSESGLNIDKAGRRVLYHEIYLRVDYDQDGLQEWRRVCTVGDRAEKILMNEPVSSHPFVNLCPFPEAHDWTGLSFWHILRDIQRVKTNILRSMLDSLSLSVHPRMAFMDGQVSVKDLMNNQVGALVRMRQPNAVQPLSVPYTGAQAQPMLDYFDSIREERTGVTKAAAGLDPDVLQSTTASAVNNTISQAQQKIEMIARVFAETGLTQLFRGLLKLVVENQDQVQTLRLRDQWIPMHPQLWDASYDVEVNVGLGSGDDAFKLASLQQIAAKQEQVLQIAGIDNPLVDISQLYNTYSRMTELAGFKDVSAFWKDPKTAPPPPPPEPPEPSAEELLAQVQREQIQATVQIDSARLQLDQDKAQTSAVLEQAKMESDAQLKLAELEAKYNQSIDSTQLRETMATQRELVRQQGLLEARFATNRRPE